MPVVILNADHTAPWELAALACALLLLASFTRRVPWACWTLTALGTLAMIAAGLIWAGLP